MISVLRHHAPSGVLPLLISEILLVCASFYVAAIFLMPPDPSFYVFYEGGLERFLLMLAGLVISFYFFDLYSDLQIHSRIVLLQQLCQAIGLTLVLQSVIAYAAPTWILPHWLMLNASVISLAVIFAWRMFYCGSILHVVGKERVLFIGQSLTVREIVREIETDPSTHLQVSGFIEDADLPRLSEVVSERRPGRIVVGMTERRDRMPIAELLALRFAGMRIEEASTTYELVYRRLCSRELQPGKLIFSRELLPPSNSAWFALFINRLLAALLLVVSLPLLAVMFVALRMKSGEPVFTSQPRVGKDGLVFRMLRLRGGFHLGALPALWNVIRGEMSLVGPLPEDPAESVARAREQPLHEYRQNVRPGLAGWAQIHGSAAAPCGRAEALEYDLYYIKHMSFALDAYILVHTFKNRLLHS